VPLAPFPANCHWKGPTMQIAQAHATEIEDLISHTQCPRDFDCYRTVFEHLCKAALVSGTGLVECHEEGHCSFQTPFADIAYCTCAVRKYIVKNLGL